jgi:hypothetical protein
VPSFDHEILVELFRNDGRLAPELLRTCAGYQIDHARVELGSVDLSQVASTEYRADAVAILRDGDNHPVAGVIVEIQRQIDRDKQWSWPIYVATLRARLRCPAVLLVLVPTSDVAAWARREIDLGHPGFRLMPIVVDFHDIPRIVDRETASYLPELAVLSALAHPEPEITQVAFDVLDLLPEERRRLYFDVIWRALPMNLRQLMEVHVQRYEYQSDFARNYEFQSNFARKYYGQGREEGREEGRKESRERLQAAAVALARAKLETVSDDDLAKIGAITDLGVLGELVTSLAAASSADESRVVLESAPAG